MSAKRRAATELTKDNWDEEEEEVQEVRLLMCNIEINARQKHDA